MRVRFSPAAPSNLIQTMEREPRPEPETKELPELTLVLPQDDQNVMVAFSAEQLSVCAAMNEAIKFVLQERQLQPFHQVGTSPEGEHLPGYHAWEVWQEVDPDDIRELFPEILRTASQYRDRFAWLDDADSDLGGLT